MKQDILCFLRQHRYEVYKEEPIFNIRNEEIGKCLISRCKHCGKIKQVKVITKTDY